MGNKQKKKMSKADLKKMRAKKLKEATKKRIINNKVRKEMRYLERFKEFDSLKSMGDTEVMGVLYDLANAKALCEYNKNPPIEKKALSLSLSKGLRKHKTMDDLSDILPDHKSLNQAKFNFALGSEKCSLKDEISETYSKADNSEIFSIIKRDSASINRSNSNLFEEKKKDLDLFTFDIYKKKEIGEDAIYEKINILQQVGKHLFGTANHFKNFLETYLTTKNKTHPPMKIYDSQYLPIKCDSGGLQPNLYENVVSTHEVYRENYQNYFLELKEKIHGCNEHDMITDENSKKILIERIIKGKNPDVTCQCFRVGATTFKKVVENKFNINTAHGRFKTPKYNVDFGNIGEAIYANKTHKNKNFTIISTGTIASHPLINFIIAKNDFLIKDNETGETILVEIKTTEKNLNNLSIINKDLEYQLAITMECFKVKKALVYYYQIQAAESQNHIINKMDPITGYLNKKIIANKYKIVATKKIEVIKKKHLLTKKVVELFTGCYVHFLEEYFLFNGFTFNEEDATYFLKKIQTHIKSKFKYYIKSFNSTKILKSNEILNREIKPDNHRKCEVLYGFIYNKKRFAQNKYIRFKQKEKGSPKRKIHYLKQRLLKLKTIYKNKIDKKKKCKLNITASVELKLDIKTFIGGYRSSMPRKVLVLSVVVFKFFLEKLSVICQQLNYEIMNKSDKEKSYVGLSLDLRKHGNRVSKPALNKRSDKEFIKEEKEYQKHKIFKKPGNKMSFEEIRLNKKKILKKYNLYPKLSNKYLTLPDKLYYKFKSLIIKNTNYFDENQNSMFTGIKDPNKIEK